MSRAQTAMKVRKHKEENPHLYCPRCFWKTGGGYCPRHTRTVNHQIGNELVRSMNLLTDEEEERILKALG